MTQAETRILRSGNTVGFTANGKHVCGQYITNSRRWRVWTEDAMGTSMSDPNLRHFDAKAAAEAYAATLVDDEATKRLAWW